jgi:hypothetical protein
MHPEDYRLEFPVVDTRPAIVTLKREAALTELSICLGQEGSRAGWFRVLRNLNPAMNPPSASRRGTQVAMPAKLAVVYERDCVDGQYQQLAQALHGARGPAEPAMRHYVVKKGDTLSSIARQVRCANVQQIASLNNDSAAELPAEGRPAAADPELPSDAVRPGESMPNRLTRPGQPCSARVWTTKSGLCSPGPTSFGRTPTKSGSSSSSRNSGHQRRMAAANSWRRLSSKR